VTLGREMKKSAKRKEALIRLKRRLEPSMPWRIAFWIFESEIRAAVAIACIVTVGLGFRLINSRHGLDSDTVRLVLSLAVFGIFLGVIVVANGDRRTHRRAEWVRMVCGAIAGAAIAHIWRGSFEVVVLSAFAGLLLGLAGMRWGQHMQL
jgi:hypothetical protein